MAKGFPSLAALLGLVAVAGYQNRDKIGEWVKGISKSSPAALAISLSSSRTRGWAVLLADGSARAPMSQCLRRKSAMRWAAISLIRSPRQTGLSREELLARLSKVLPEAVDKMTPEGRISG